MYSGSSLVDLKAELTRKEEQLIQKSKKHEEYNKKGNQTFAKIQSLTGKKKKKKKDKEIDNENKEEKETLDSETLEMLAKARQKLEAKSKIYDKMKSGEMEDFENIYGETKFLVDFQKKTLESEESLDQPPTSSIYEADEAYREKLHEKWEAEQQELLDGPVHYENIKFDEVRELGTAYYAFSKNEEERKKQMEDLQKMRNKTKEIQNKKEQLQLKRKAALQERLNKVKKKKMGLSADDSELAADKNLSTLQNPPEQITHSNIDQTDDQLQNIDELLKECRKGTEKERDWDKGKDRAFVPQPFVRPKNSIYTQDKFIREKREERPQDFAPPNFY
ncbi:coiled-coil domain-containing protein 174-like [Hydractinia symbiolongicarpus]|uniref:coiled-coil domain-containing protein 174-like n=1 Tax=Hydractinia symbiolongicarpus TaxID=13093 RepID=UPI00255186E6|nr:coiled-coil domain-containing protein 174-like [Hydractinia symbiolongicarpus]